MSRIANAAAEPKTNEVEVTPEMIEAGEEVVLGETGGADLGSLFSAADLARRVYLAMHRRRLASSRDELSQ